MRLIENIKIAVESLFVHKIRSVLTMLGIIIGVAAVIIIVAIGRGGEEMLKAQIAGEENTINIIHIPSEEEIQNNINILNQTAFNNEDVNLIKQINEVENVVASSVEYSTIKHFNKEVDASIIGITEDYLKVNKIEIQEGLNLHNKDFFGSRRVAVISTSLAEELFGKASAIGEKVQIAFQPVEIIGVTKPKSGLFSMGLQEVFIPHKTWGNIYSNPNFGQVTVEAKDPEDLRIAGEKSVQLLNTRKRTTDSYQVINMAEISAGIEQVTRIMTIIISGIASISLLVGGVGVMNIMLVSVTERTREIGLRKSLGATQRQILMQFLIEAIILTFIGGVIGILVGITIIVLISMVTGWSSLLSIPILIMTLIFSMLIGVVFGFLPAKKAAKLQPIEALKYE